MAEHSYLEEIEHYFADKRGSALILSPKDWPVVTAWEEQGIPLELIFEGIDRAFNRLEETQSLARRRSLRTLAACKYDVEKVWKEWQETHTRSPQSSESDASDQVQAEKQRFLARLRSVITQLRKIAEKPKYQRIADALLLTSDTLESILSAIEKSADDVSFSHFRQQVRQCEHELITNLEAALTPEESQALQTKVEAQLAPYKANMKSAVYQETRRIAFLKALREAYPLPSFP